MNYFIYLFFEQVYLFKTNLVLYLIFIIILLFLIVYYIYVCILFKSAIFDYFGLLFYFYYQHCSCYDLIFQFELFYFILSKYTCLSICYYLI